jgi:esterase/lipase/1-acyl-sn-glycerol-3-phosphate acyltransferase
MASFAFRATKRALDLLSRLIRADVRVHNLDVIEDDMAVIFCVNHFTRLETLLLPYVFYKHKNIEVWSLAASDLFAGWFGSAFLSIGAVSTKDPDRDKIIIHSLLSAEHPWLIFPEGQMVKDKKVVDAQGVFRVYNDGKLRPPHTGPAVLALRAEFYRQKLACLRDRPDQGGLGEVLERFDLASFDQIEGKRTVIIPVNVTYYPIRSRDNTLTFLARGLDIELTGRALEELTIEGTLVSAENDIDITLGEPIDVREYLHEPEYAELMACGERDLELLEADGRSLFNEAARKLMFRYMRAIYDLTTINYDHLFASLIQHKDYAAFTERSYRNRIFLCAHLLKQSDLYRMHTILARNYHEIIYEDPSVKFDEFIELCIREGVVSKQEDRYVKNRNVKRGQSGFHEVRTKEPTYVIANETEPLPEFNAIIQRVARMARTELSETVRQIFIEEDTRLFEEDYARFADDASHPRDVGRPFLLVPEQFEAGVVLVHGYLAAPREVRALAEYLYDRGYAVYAVRVRGHGTAPEDLATREWKEWYESVNRGYTIIKSFTDRIIIGGFSTGGALALLAAGLKGRRVEACFAICAPLQLRNIAARLAPSIVTFNQLVKRLRRGSFRWEYVSNDSENKHINYARNPLTGVRELGGAMEAMEAALPAVESPALVIQASKDTVVDAASGQLIFDKIGTRFKELNVFERDRHGIVNGPGSEDIFARVHQFLQWAERVQPEVDLDEEAPPEQATAS